MARSKTYSIHGIKVKVVDNMMISIDSRHSILTNSFGSAKMLPFAPSCICKGLELILHDLKQLTTRNYLSQFPSE